MVEGEFILRSKKKYDSAAYCYQELLKKYPRNAMVQYNLGNAYFQLKKVGPSILHLQKAAVLDPRNAQIAENLEAAKARIQNPVSEAKPIFFLRWWENALHALSTNTWAIISLVVFAGTLLLVWYARVKKDAFRHAGRWLSLAIVSLIICGCMTWLTYQAVVDSRLGVIVQSAVNFFDTPKANGKLLGALPEGTVVEVFSRKGDYINVKLPNGREGWILAADFEKV